MLKLKLAAILFIFSFLLSNGTLFTAVTIHTAYAQDSGTVAYQLTINYNATEFGKSAPNQHTLVITEQGLLKPDTGPIKDLRKAASEESGTIDPPIVEQKSFQYIDPSITPLTTTIDAEGTSIQIYTLPDAQLAYISTYLNGTIKHSVDVADFATNFVVPTDTYPSIQKMVVFDSPYNYVIDYCHTQGWIYDCITDVHLNQTMDFATLSKPGSTFIGDKYGLFNQSLWDPDAQEYLSRTGVDLRALRFGTALINKAIGVDDLIVLLALACIFIFCWKGIPEITKWVAGAQLSKTTRAEIYASQQVALASINKEYNITMSLIEGKQVFETNVLAMLSNGTITYDQAMDFLGLTGVGYENMINQRATNIRMIAEDYYNHTEQVMGGYYDAMVAIATWSDWFTNLVILIFVVIAAYFIYAILIKRKNQGAATTQVFYPPPASR